MHNLVKSTSRILNNVSEDLYQEINRGNKYGHNSNGTGNKSESRALQGNRESGKYGRDIYKTHDPNKEMKSYPRINISKTFSASNTRNYDYDCYYDQGYDHYYDIDMGSDNDNDDTSQGTITTGEEDLCRELMKLKHSEETFKHEMNFAIDKIAYGHASTMEFARKRRLLPALDWCGGDNMNDGSGEGDGSANGNGLNFIKEEENVMDKFLACFCCNHGYNDETMPQED